MTSVDTGEYKKLLELERVRLHGAEVEAALQRIVEGNYGVCEVCGEPIGGERLSAIPWARLCIDDQRRLG